MVRFGQALKEAGIRNYSIHHASAIDILFALLWREDDHSMDNLPEMPVMQRWWASMAPLMETNADGSPVSVALETVFHLNTAGR